MVDNLVNKVRNDAIMIPTGGPTYDASRALSALFSTNGDYERPFYIISGAMGEPTEEGEVTYGPNTRIKEYLNQFNIPDKKIIQEYKSRDTLGNIYETSKICEEKGIKRLGVSSEYTHINRIKNAHKKLVKMGCVNDNLEICPIVVNQNNVPLKSKLRYFFYINAANLKDKLMLDKEIKKRYLE